mmetsp:Transcript_22044/g.39514  ORF Transcript_22044/g.39514 Transcript_22044/m.39514 type:complete len:239 (+) Transcript_22044:31-747(+)
MPTVPCEGQVAQISSGQNSGAQREHHGQVVSEELRHHQRCPGRHYCPKHQQGKEQHQHVAQSQADDTPLAERQDEGDHSTRPSNCKVSREEELWESWMSHRHLCQPHLALHQQVIRDGQIENSRDDEGVNAIQRALVNPAPKNDSLMRDCYEGGQANHDIQRRSQHFRNNIGKRSQCLVADDQVEDGSIHKAAALQVSIWAQSKRLEQATPLTEQAWLKATAGVNAAQEERSKSYPSR